MKKMSKEDFINRSVEKHGERYDYSEVIYKNSHTPVRMKCNECGNWFEQKPYKHLSGQGCPVCNGKFRKTKEQFISEAKKVHGDDYDYSFVDYVNTETYVDIKCNKCGTIFKQLPYAHLQGKGCARCNGGRKKTIEEFIEDAIKIHGDKYDYSKVVYANNKTKVCIICPSHGEFWQTPNDHLDGCGCPICNESRLEHSVRIKLTERNIDYIQQYSTDWLGRQSLDFYLPDYNIAIECQGIQHFKPVKHFGGEERFETTKQLDERKRLLCEENNVKMVYLKSNEEIESYFNNF